jgi:hypothetical protein
MTDCIRTTIDKFPFGFVFTPSDFPVESGKQASVNRILNNMVAAGEIRRLSKGRFYKPKVTPFGELPPDTYQVVKDLIEKNGKITGYITGYSAFNDFGLTTQVPFSLQIGVRNEKKAIKRDVYQISFIKQQNSITKDNIPLLRLLDCLRFFKNIPDALPNNTCKRLLYLFSQLDRTQVAKIKKLALKYNPSTIALLGAILQTINEDEETSILLNKLNPQTSYKLGISKEILHNQEKWYIK